MATSKSKGKNELHADHWLERKAPDWKEGSDPKAQKQVYVFCQEKEATLRRQLSKVLSEWQVAQIFTEKSSSIFPFSTEKGLVYVVLPSRYAIEDAAAGHKGILDQGDVGRVRNSAGHWYRQYVKSKDAINIHFSGPAALFPQLLYGLYLADYSSKSALKDWDGPKTTLRFSFDQKVPQVKKVFEEVFLKASGHNLARHLSNLPANYLNPKTFADFVAKLFNGQKTTKVKIWEAEDLRNEGFGLLYGVGAGSTTGSRLVHIRYRPSGKQKPIALIGKGVTFDTGGLDIKPSSNMRLMKKDMSGAAVLTGIAFANIFGKGGRPLDFYLALTENAVSAEATRPGDVHISRAGIKVEIHNTDAEGRLAMADALSLALEATGKDEPEFLLDTATLTGAMRVSVGLDVAGYFSNDDKLSQKVDAAAKSVGEYVWRMPLFPKYNRMFGSQIADVSNATDSAFGGAITAALFLQKFVKDKAWAHFDVMAWNSSADGAYSEGANGQTYLVLSELVR